MYFVKSNSGKRNRPGWLDTVGTGQSISTGRCQLVAGAAKAEMDQGDGPWHSWNTDHRRYGPRGTLKIHLWEPLSFRSQNRAPELGLTQGCNLLISDQRGPTQQPNSSPAKKKNLKTSATRIFPQGISHCGRYPNNLIEAGCRTLESSTCATAAAPPLCFERKITAVGVHIGGAGLVMIYTLTYTITPLCKNCTLLFSAGPKATILST